MTKQRPDTATIANELEGASLFFSQPKPDQPSPPVSHHERPEERTSERNSVRSKNRTEMRTVSIPIRRSSRRYSFEFYDDQLIEMKRLKHEAEMRGEKVSLSDIARLAIDTYLKHVGVRNSERKSERLAGQLDVE